MSATHRHAELTVQSVPYDVEFGPPQGEFLVAWCGGEPAGCGGFRRVEEGLAELPVLVVRPEWRRRGVGRLLLRGLEERAWASGYGAMRLGIEDSLPSAAAALALYRANGYRVIPRFPPHCDDLSRVCMAKELPPPFAESA